jgi:REP element-mobilizing transposase RayT
LVQFHHIYNRGVDRSPIFFNRDNWFFFLKRLREYASPDQADILAYCLMPNHYHVLCEVKVDDFGKSVMQPFSVSYTKAINKQQGRVGSLFQGPFQARRVDSDSYLVHLTRYIHLNPVTANLVQ